MRSRLTVLLGSVSVACSAIANAGRWTAVAVTAPNKGAVRLFLHRQREAIAELRTVKVKLANWLKEFNTDPKNSIFLNQKMEF